MPKTEANELELDLWASDETRQVTLAPGIWVEIKEELDHGEEQAMAAASIRGLTRQQIVNAAAADENEMQDIVLTDTARLRFLKLAFYIVEWNLKDKQGRKVTLPTRLEDRIRILKRLKNKWGERISDEIDALRTEKDNEAKGGDTDPNQKAAASPNGQASPSGEKLLTAATP